MTRFRFIHVAVAIALLALVLWKSGARDIGGVLGDADYRLLAVVVALNVPLALLFPVRSHFVLMRLGARIDPQLLVPAMILGNVAGSLTPASSGELLRTAVLRSHADLPARDGLALVLYERGISVWIMALGTGVAAGFVGLGVGMALVVAAASLPLFALPAIGPFLLRLLPETRDEATSRRARMIFRANDVAGRMRWLLEDRTLLLGWSMITAAMFVIASAQIWLLTESVGDAVRPHEAWVAYGASQLAGIVSLLPLGLGAADGSLSGLLRRMGMTLEQGASVAILSRAALTLPLGLMAVASYIWLTRERKKPLLTTPAA